MILRVMLIAFAVAASVIAGAAPFDAAQGEQRTPPIRLYVFDGGVLESDPGRYRLKPNEVVTSQLSIAAYLVVHPRGTLMWDATAVNDTWWVPDGGRPVVKQLVLSNGQDRQVTLRTPLRTQVAAAGYKPENITYLALSHYHWDHVANANDFARATWLVRQSERDGLFPNPQPTPPYPSGYAYLQNSKTTLITADEHDVFGDGAVVIKSTPGHTPGHQVLYVKLARTGGVVLAGDLYHYPEERTLNRLPTTEFNEAQTARSRADLDAFLKKTGAQLWIQHDLIAHAKLRKSPEFYD